MLANIGTRARDDPTNKANRQRKKKRKNKKGKTSFRREKQRNLLKLKCMVYLYCCILNISVYHVHEPRAGVVDMHAIRVKMPRAMRDLF